jgi:N-acetyl-anhydromuramyl-L-alanine amidase AmpD
MKINNLISQLPRHRRNIYKTIINRPIDYIVIHHSAGKGETIRGIANYHVYERNYPGIGYHYCILNDGTIHQVNHDDTVSYHCKGHNTKSIGICVLGNFDIEALNINQKAALHFLIAQLKMVYHPWEILGHSELGKTKCPGTNLINFLTTYKY